MIFINGFFGFADSILPPSEAQNCRLFWCQFSKCGRGEFYLSKDIDDSCVLKMLFDWAERFDDELLAAVEVLDDICVEALRTMSRIELLQKTRALYYYELD